MKSRKNLFGLAVLGGFCLCGMLSAVEVLEPGYNVETYTAYSTPGIGEGPWNMTFASDGNLYATQISDHSIWRITPEGVATRFVVFDYSPAHIVWGGGTEYGDYLYVRDNNRYDIVRVGLDGTISNFANKPCNFALGIDRTGNYGGYMYATTSCQDHTYQIDFSGNVSLFSSFPGYNDGGGPCDIGFDIQGNYGGLMYIALAFNNSAGNQHKSGLFSLDQSGNPTRFAESLVLVNRVDFDPAGSFGGEMFVTGKQTYDEISTLWRVGPDGTATEFARTILSPGFLDLTFGPDGALYVAGYDEGAETVVISRISKIDESLVAHWKFDEGGGSVAYDSAGDNDGTVHGAQWGDGVLGGALDFDGVSDYVEVPNNSSQQMAAGQITVSTWIMLNKDIGYNQVRIICKQQHNGLAWGLEMIGAGRSGATGNQLVFHDSNGSTFHNFISSTHLSPFRWYHVVVTDNDGLVTIYLDGQEDYTSNGGFGIPSNIDAPIIMGKTNPVDTFYFNGVIDDIRIYNRVLSAGEVKELYGREDESGLVAHWKFDEGEGSVAYDSAGDNDGTVRGATWADGMLDGALDFDGVDDYVALPDNSPVWLPKNDFTLSVWAYFDRDPDPSLGETLLDLNFADSANPSNELGYVVSRAGSTYSGQVAFGLTTVTATDEDLHSNGLLLGGRWYHVVAVRDGTTQAIYIDGVLDNSRICSGDPIKFVGGYDDDRVSIGRCTTTNSPNGTFHFNGKVDDVRIYGRALSAGEVEELYKQVANGGLVAHWKFDEGGELIAYDSAGDNDGTVYGATWVDGVLDGALDFDGVDDYVEAASSESLKLDAAGTVSAWVRPTSLYRQSLVNKKGVVGDGNKSENYWLTFGSYNQCTIVIGDGVSYVSATIPEEDLAVNTWQHVVGTWDSSEISIYLNGNLIDVQPNNLSNLVRSDSYPLRIGHGSRADWPFDGLLDDVRIYDRALSAGEVEELYGEEVGPFLAKFVVVRKERVGRTVFEYDCDVVLQNLSPFVIENVSLEMAEWPGNMTIIKPNVSFGGAVIRPGESATSVDTCTFRVDRSEAIDPAEIIWHITAELADSGVKMEHTLSSRLSLGPEPVGFDGLREIAAQWLWRGPAGGIEEDSVQDGTVNLLDFARLANNWLGSQ